MKESVADTVVSESNKSQTIERDFSSDEQSESVLQKSLEDPQIYDKSQGSGPSRDYLVLEHLSSCGLIIAS